MLDGLVVYNYRSSSEFLSAVLEMKKQAQPSYSLRQWAQRLGTSAMTLSRVLRGMRPCQEAVLDKIAEQLGMNLPEKNFLFLLNQFEFAKETKEKSRLWQKLTELYKKSDVNFLEADQFRLVSDWYHFAIMEMTRLKDFKGDAKYIARRLGGGVTEGTVKAALERLVRVGILEADSQRGYRRIPNGTVKAGDQGENRAVRLHHEQMIRKAFQALAQDPMEDKDFYGKTMTMKKSDLPRFKQRLREFQKEIAETFAVPSGDETYQMNVQLFRLTQGEGVEGAGL